MAGIIRAAGRPLRWLARLLIRPNPLQRRSDRIERAIAALLSAAFLAAVAAAPVLGVHFYQAQRAGAARLRPATAVLTRPGPDDSYFMAAAGETTARWRAPDGRPISGVLTDVTAPAIQGAPAGAEVRVWLTPSGEPQAPPSEAAQVVFASVAIAIGAVFVAGLALVGIYWLCRLVLDRRRLAGWERAWTAISPRWTTRL